jgi:D-alanyl-D-alanine carboxypeptidase (penicillin-binding protein 5/6)
LSTKLRVVLSLILVAVPSLPRPVAGAQAPSVEVSCRACLIVDGDGTTIWARRAEEPVAVASATKMVTALVVRARADLADEVEVSATAAAIPGGRLSLVAGESFSVAELLYGMLMNSSNDAAVALAEHVAGSEQAFVDEMNLMAQELGAGDSHFVTAHGLDRPGHLSTARDLALFATEVLADPFLAEIVGTFRFEIEGSLRTVELENTNVLLESYPGMIGVKTGFTSDAGNVLVAAAERRGRRIITVALGSVDHFADTVALLDHGFAVLRETVLLQRGTPVASLVVAGGGAGAIVAGRSVRGLDDPATVAIDYRPDPGAAPPFEAGQVVGRVVVTSRGRVLARVTAVTESPVEAAQDGGVAGLLAGVIGAVGRLMPGEG